MLRLDREIRRNARIEGAREIVGLALVAPDVGRKDHDIVGQIVLDTHSTRIQGRRVTDDAADGVGRGLSAHFRRYGADGRSRSRPYLRLGRDRPADLVSRGVSAGPNTPFADVCCRKPQSVSRVPQAAKIGIDSVYGSTADARQAREAQTILFARNPF